MYLVLLLLIVLAVSLGGLALVGHRAVANLELWRYLILSLAAWLGASLFLYALVVWSPAVAGNEPLIARGVGGLAVLATVCFAPVALVGSVLYCWGAHWSRERHVVVALATSIGVAVLAVPLTLASTCALQGNCL